MENASTILFPSGAGEMHHVIFTRSIQFMSQTLKSNIYNLDQPGCPVDTVLQSDLDTDPLIAVRYSCVYWVDHLEEYISGSLTSTGVSQALGSQTDTHHPHDLVSGGRVHKFLGEKYLYWLEALYWLQSLSQGVLALEKLGNLLVGGD